jgi:hypothetical protein
VVAAVVRLQFVLAVVAVVALGALQHL